MFFRGSSGSESGTADSDETRSSHHSMNMLDNYIDHYGEYNYAYIIDNE